MVSKRLLLHVLVSAEDYKCKHGLAGAFALQLGEARSEHKHVSGGPYDARVRNDFNHLGVFEHVVRNEVFVLRVERPLERNAFAGHLHPFAK